MHLYSVVKEKDLGFADSLVDGACHSHTEEA